MERETRFCSFLEEMENSVLGGGLLPVPGSAAGMLDLDPPLHRHSQHQQQHQHQFMTNPSAATHHLQMQQMGLAGDHQPLSLLICAVQTYDWGRMGEDSYVARLSTKNSGLAVDAGKPYAELWMGTHPSGPSFLAAAVDAREAPKEEEEETKGVPLKQWIEEYPSVLGKKVAERWGGDLPFLFKVLSVAKALSIPAHPDKELARKLHEQQLSVYKDDNHKPEMALALTEFRALCGFVSLEIVEQLLNKI